MILFVSWARGLSSDLNIRAAVVAVLWLLNTALVYARGRALIQFSREALIYSIFRPFNALEALIYQGATAGF
ncbi:hypothetical protein AL047_08875 [Pseudomonas syringae pv. broussonetiae]|nr:hypothetical protein AL047_08875 [Pseudomonas syringae pv. broussonetiae]